MHKAVDTVGVLTAVVRGVTGPKTLLLFWQNGFLSFLIPLDCQCNFFSIQEKKKYTWR